jgi:hypothetical protein
VAEAPRQPKATPLAQLKSNTFAMSGLKERLQDLRNEIAKILEDARQDRMKPGSQTSTVRDDDQRLREARLREIMDELKGLGETGKS